LDIAHPAARKLVDIAKAYSDFAKKFQNIQFDIKNLFKG